MIIATLIVAIAGAVAAAAAWHEARRVRLEAAEPPVGLAGRAVLISTRGDSAMRGIVQADLPDRVTLREATVIAVGRDAEVPARGLLHVYRDRIDYIQDTQEAPAPSTKRA